MIFFSFSLSSVAITVLLSLSLALNANAWETEQQAASQLVDLISSPNTFGVTTLSTLYPSDHPDESLRGSIASGAEYYASGCFPDSGDVLMLGMPVSQNWRNVLPPSSNPNVTLSINSNPDPQIPDPRHLSKHNSHSHPSKWDEERPSWRRGMPSKIRTQLLGSIQVINQADFKEGLGWIEISKGSEAIEEETEKTTSYFSPKSIFQKIIFSNLRLSFLPFKSYSVGNQEKDSSTTIETRFPSSSPEVEDEVPSFTTSSHSSLSKCYLEAHPDSSHWTPGSDESDSPHKAMWVRVKVERIYSVGGFGDEHRIGFVSKGVWEEAWKGRK